MERVLVYSPGGGGELAGLLSGYELLELRTKLELTEAIVSKSPIFCLIVSQERLSEEMRGFLFSLKKSFPILAVCVVTPGTEPSLPEGCRHFDGSLASDRLRKSVAGFVASVTRTDRREHLRYDWPLQGFLSVDRAQWQPYRVRALSSSGAFLECDGLGPEPGAHMYVRIVFQDHALNTACEILPARAASSNLPPGFGIRFSGLGMLARAIIERVVADSLIRSLLEPEEEPEMPTLGGEDLLEAGFEVL